MDQVEGLEDLLTIARSASGAIAALDAMVHLTAVYTPRIYRLAPVLEVARRSDRDFDAAWQDRMAHRRRNMGAVAKLLADTGDLAEGITVKTGTDILWTMLSVHIFEDLVVDRGWSIERYQEFIRDVLHHRLLRPPLDGGPAARPEGLLERRRIPRHPARRVPHPCGAGLCSLDVGTLRRPASCQRNIPSGVERLRRTP